VSSDFPSKKIAWPEAWIKIYLGEGKKMVSKGASAR
jgi:hypothetical protein